MIINPPGSFPAGPQSGYQGLGAILSFLQNGIGQDQFDLLNQGFTGKRGGNGGNLGAAGLFAGLSPYAAHYLASSGILEKQAPALQDTAGLTGNDLFRTTLMNALLQQNADANPMYKPNAGVDADFLQQLFGAGFGGHSAYAKGFGASGKLPIRPIPRDDPSLWPGRGPKGPRPFNPLPPRRAAIKKQIRANHPGWSQAKVHARLLHRLGMSPSAVPMAR